jgi:8-oxo-dGTP pyrophosphatase MutT (NUDIX family)
VDSAITGTGINVLVDLADGPGMCAVLAAHTRRTTLAAAVEGGSRSDPARSQAGSLPNEGEATGAASWPKEPDTTPRPASGHGRFTNKYQVLYNISMAANIDADPMSFLQPSISGGRQGSSFPSGHEVTAVIVEWRGRIALLRRSQKSGHDQGKWHCVTGYLDEGMGPQEQAVLELFEETDLQLRDLLSLTAGPVLELFDEAGTLWLVHTFVARTARRRLKLNWEHDTFRWVLPRNAKRFSNRVSWLDRVLLATGHLTE